MLGLSDLSCSRGDRVLFSGANLQLSPGEALYVTGPNGAGKTTLLRVICGLAMPEHGDVLWNGESTRKLREEYARDLLFLGHAAALKDELSAVENLTVAASISGHQVTPEQAITALRQFGLKGREDLPTRVLSAGQRRRVNLARLILPSPPRLWILDEPFTALDVKAVGQLAGILAGHLRGGGMVIYTTHQDVEFPGCVVRRLVIESGKATPC
jgi:heme exporter protein A